MRLAALTGLSRESISDLIKRGIRTFAIRSAHNLIVFSEVNVGDRVFVTDVVPPDVVSGLCGHIATVRGIDIHMNRVAVATPLDYEEREAMIGRVQLVLQSAGKVREVPHADPYRPLYVDVIELKSCEAR
jgi:hypothetical protein